MVGINVPIPVPVGYHSFGVGMILYLEIQQCMAQKECVSIRSKKLSQVVGLTQQAVKST